VYQKLESQIDLACYKNRFCANIEGAVRARTHVCWSTQHDCKQDACTRAPGFSL